MADTQIIPAEQIAGDVQRAYASLPSDAHRQAVDIAHGILNQQAASAQQPVPAAVPSISPSRSLIPALGNPLDYKNQPQDTPKEMGQFVPPYQKPAPLGSPAIGAAPDVPTAAQPMPQIATGRIAPLGSQLGPPPPTPVQAEHMRLAQSGSGASQIHNPWLRGLAIAGDALGSTFAPKIAAVIPGTTIHHAVLESQAARADSAEQQHNQEQRAQDQALLAQQEQPAVDELRQAQIAHTNAQAHALENPATAALKPKEPSILFDKAGDPIGYQDESGKMYGIHDAALPPGVKDILGEAKAKPPAVKEGELPLTETQIAQLNPALEQRYQVNHPGQKVPDNMVLKSGATQKDYDRVDKLMEAIEKAQGTKAQQETANEMRKQTAALAARREERSESKPDAATEREYMAVRGGLNKQFESAQAQIDKIQQAKAELQGGAVGQAVGTIKTLASLASGQGSGVRITGAELNALIHARGIKGDFDGWISRMEGKGQLPPEQIKQMSDVLSDVERKAADKQGVHAKYLDQLGGAKSTKDIRDIESSYRKELMGTGGGEQKSFTQADVDAAVKAHPGSTAAQIEKSFKDGGWVKK